MRTFRFPKEINPLIVVQRVYRYFGAHFLHSHDFTGYWYVENATRDRESGNSLAVYSWGIKVWKGRK
jgi:hypothetical protein